jgi:glycosyltransferase involved in cell wall biosynthesis
VNANVVWRVVRAEGVAATLDRLRDRRAETRRRRSFRPAAAPPSGFACAVLNLAAAPPAPRLGGVQAQLLWRLEAEAALRPVALLFPEEPAAGGGYRLELQSGRERRALHLPPAASGACPSGRSAWGRRIPSLASLWARVWDGRGQTAAPPPKAGHGGHPPPRDLPPPLRPPISSPTYGVYDLELERAVAWAAGHCGATLLQVEGLAGMPLDSLLRLRQAGLRLVLAIHDFAAFCPRPHLLESVAPPAPPRFCHYSRDAARCARCLGRDAAGLPPGYQERRRELARQLLAGAGAVVYPSPFLARTYRELFGGTGALGDEAARVIGPAAAPALLRARPAGPPRRPRPPRHVAWVGAVQAHKGALVFEAAVQRLAAAGRRLRLTAYGGGDAEILARWRRLPGLRVRGYYRAGSLPALLQRDGVDLALLLSVVPESYGLTLDECAAAGVPVVAFDHGALAERIASAASGLLLAAAVADDPAAAGAALASLLADLLDGRLEPPPPPIPPPGQLPPAPAPAPRLAAAAAADWLELYRELGLRW